VCVCMYVCVCDDSDTDLVVLTPLLPGTGVCVRARACMCVCVCVHVCVCDDSGGDPLCSHSLTSWDRCGGVSGCR